MYLLWYVVVCFIENNEIKLKFQQINIHCPVFFSSFRKKWGCHKSLHNTFEVVCPLARKARRVDIAKTFELLTLFSDISS